jgi:hypothetical protein
MEPADFSPVKPDAAVAGGCDLSRRNPVKVIFGVRPFFAWLMDPSNTLTIPANADPQKGTFDASLWGESLYSE